MRLTPLALATLVGAQLAGTASFAQPVPEEPKPATGRIRVASLAVRPDADRGTKDGIGLELAFGRAINERWSWETVLSSTILEMGDWSGTDHYQTGLGFHVARWFGGVDQAVVPFFSVGAGVIENDVSPDANDSTDPYLEAGGGVLTREIGNTALRLRAEAQYLHDTHRTGMSDWRIQLGAVVPIGKSRVEREVVERIVYRDAPAAAVAPAPPPPPAPAPPADSDGDRVLDGADACPNTFAGAVVDERGCVRAAQSVAIEGVTFEFNSANLTESAQRILDRAYLALRDQPGTTVEIAGHTDSVGSEAQNLAVSARRAEAVRVYLIGRGIDGARLTARGFGESEPLVSEVTDADRARNRRVEFRIGDTR